MVLFYYSHLQIDLSFFFSLSVMLWKSLLVEIVVATEILFCSIFTERNEGMSIE